MTSTAATAATTALVPDEDKGDRERRVVWDEKNLEANAEYHRLHPVTMKIDEPKTPYHNLEDEGLSVEDQLELAKAEQQELEHGVEAARSGWDARYNAVAKEAKLVASSASADIHHTDDKKNSTGEEVEKEKVVEANDASAGVKKQRRPLMIATEVDEDKAEEVEKKKKAAEFKMMRKTVYADEGKNFRELLKAKAQEQDEDDDEDEK